MNTSLISSSIHLVTVEWSKNNFIVILLEAEDCININFHYWFLLNFTVSGDREEREERRGNQHNNTFYFQIFPFFMLLHSTILERTFSFIWKKIIKGKFFKRIYISLNIQLCDNYLDVKQIRGDKLSEIFWEIGPKYFTSQWEREREGENVKIKLL